MGNLSDDFEDGMAVYTQTTSDVKPQGIAPPGMHPRMQTANAVCPNPSIRPAVFGLELPARIKSMTTMQIMVAIAIAAALVAAAYYFTREGATATASIVPQMQPAAASVADMAPQVPLAVTQNLAATGVNAMFRSY